MPGLAPKSEDRPVRFGPFELDPHTHELRKLGIRIKTRGQPIQLLQVLIERAGETVSREELRQRLWAEDTFVDFDHSLNTAIKRLRQALDDDPEVPRYIETIPRFGYRFIGTIDSSPIQPVLLATTPQDPIIVAPVRAARKLPGLSIFILASVAVALGALVVWRVVAPRTQESPAVGQVTPVTSLPGQEIAPALSLDGTRVAFGWDGETNGSGFDIYVKVIGNEGQLRLTHSPSMWVGTAWSPDGRYIAIARTGNKPGVFLVPALGGPERKLADLGGAMIPGMLLAWSRDGKRLAFVKTSLTEPVGTSSLEIVRLDSLQAEVLSSDCPRSLGPSFSPDDTALSYACLETWNNTSLRIRDLKTGDERILAKFKGWTAGTVWTSDGHRITYPVLSYESSTQFHLLAIATDGNGQPKEILGARDSNMISVVGNRLVFADSRENTNIWKVPIDGSGAAQKLIASTAEQNAPRVSPDGKRIAFESTRSGNREVWVADIDGSNALQVSASNGPLTGSPTWSPDNVHLAFDSRIGGRANIYVVDTSSGAIKKLQIATELNSIPIWSRDGKWIYYQQGEDAAPTFWRVSLSDSHSVQLSTLHGMMVTPRESFDGKYLYVVCLTEGEKTLWRIHTDGSGEERAVEQFPIRVGGDFFPVESGIYFTADSRDNRQEIQFMDFRNGQVRRIYSPPVPLEDWTGGLEVTPDRKWILFTQLDSRESDLKLLENWE